jgi:hypothetical protein
MMHLCVCERERERNNLPEGSVVDAASGITSVENQCDGSHNEANPIRVEKKLVSWKRPCHRPRLLTHRGRRHGLPSRRRR